MLILKNKLPHLSISSSSFPKFASQVQFIQPSLLYMSTVSSPMTSKNSIVDFHLHNKYTSLINIFFKTRRYLQSIFLFKSVLLLSKPDIFVFPSLLNSCSFLPYIDHGLVIHGYLLKYGFKNWVGAGNKLVLMYMKFGLTLDAYKVFEEMPVKNGDTFNSLMFGLRVNGFYEDVVIAFERMVGLGIAPDLDCICHVIMACSELRSVEKGISVHDYVKQTGLDMYVPVANSLVSMYVKMGRLDLGRQVFNRMRERDIVSWNSLITGYAQCGKWVEVFDLFLLLSGENGSLLPNAVTLLNLLSACGEAGALYVGMSVHGHLIRAGLYSDFRLGTAIVDMYAKCKRVDCAQAVFNEDLFEKTLVSWNALIARYAQNGYNEEAACLYEQMFAESKFKPDSFTLANVLPAYASLGNLGRIKSIHSIIIKRALDMDGDVVLGTAMIDAYGKCLDINAAKSLFTCIWRPCTATWNTLIAAYNLNHQIEQGMLLFLTMLQSNVLPDPITMVMLLQSCGESGCLKQGNMIHGFCLSKGFSSHLIVGNAILDMYLRCGFVKCSEIFFRSMCLKNIVTWNTMIQGYAKVGDSSMAIRVFCQMQLENQYKPDSVTMISVVQASAAVLTNYGAEISHAYILKLGLTSHRLVMNSLIHVYAKNGFIEKARALFIQIGCPKDQSSWNIMISGYGINGQGREACNLFSEMEEAGYKPDSITFTSLLSSCNHCGLIEEGCRFFDMMVTKYKIQPGKEHWTCIIDMLGRDGRLGEAYEIMKSRLNQNFNNNVPLESNAAWGALLAACSMNMNMELGELAGRKLSLLEPYNCGYHSLLSNLFSSNERWDEATKIRKVFGEGKLMKKPGSSIVNY